MEALLNIVKAYLFMFLFGYTLLSILNKNLANRVLLSPFVGYTVSQLLFYCVFLVTRNAFLSFYIIMFFFGSTLIYGFVCKDLINLIKQINVKRFASFLFIGILIVFVYAYPYLHYGTEYLHSGNEDIFDALNGRDYYLGNISKLGQFLFSDKDIANFLNVRGTIDKSFLYGSIALQYSTVTFWSIFLNSFYTFDPFVVQAVVNILLMASGIFLLFNKSFEYSTVFSLGVALLSVFSNLYLTSFINGHEGSMIFGAVMPFIMILGLSYKSKNSFGNKKIILCLSVIGLLFILLSYPHPAIFFVVPFFLYILEIRLRSLCKIIANNKVILFFAISTLVGMFFLGYLILLDYNTDKYRSWGISFALEMLMIYWGILQSQVASGKTINNFVYHMMELKLILLSLSFVFLFITLYGVKKAIRRNSYFLYFSITWGGFFVLLRFVVADSYYFYKFLYTTQFLFIYFFLLGIKSIYQQEFRYAKTAAIFVIFLFIGFNLPNGIFLNHQLFSSEINKNYKGFKSITDAPKEVLHNAYLDIPNQSYLQITDLFLRKDQIFAKRDISDAKYIVLIKNVSDVTFNNNYTGNNIKTKFENDMYRIIENPKSNLLHVYGKWEAATEKYSGNFSGKPFRWMTNGAAGRKFSIKGSSIKRSFIRLCAESCAGIDYRPFSLLTSDGQKIMISGSNCSYLDVNGGDISIEFSSNIRGKKLLPFDDRELNYRIGSVGLTINEYDLESLKFLNPRNDVLPKDVEVALHDDDKIDNNVILLGNGWYSQELFGMRWGSDGMELLVMNATVKRLSCVLDIEPGPSIDKLPLTLQILDKDDRSISKFEIAGRQKIDFTLPLQEDLYYQIFKLNVLNKSKLLESDPRNLNIRIFKIDTIKEQTNGYRFSSNSGVYSDNWTMQEFSLKLIKNGKANSVYLKAMFPGNINIEYPVKVEMFINNVLQSTQTIEGPGDIDLDFDIVNKLQTGDFVAKFKVNKSGRLLPPDDRVAAMFIYDYGVK